MALNYLSAACSLTKKYFYRDTIYMSRGFVDGHEFRICIRHFFTSLTDERRLIFFVRGVPKQLRTDGFAVTL